MDRFWTVLIWVILLSALIGVLRYGKQANTLAQTFLGWVLGESELLAGLAPNGTCIPKAS